MVDVSDNQSIIIIFALYLLFMLAIGFIYYRKTEDLSDYILGGRRLNSWVTALSSQASDMSGWLLLGLPGAAYLSGLEAGWIALGLGIGTYFNWKFIAKRLRKYTKMAGNSLTIPVFFENRFKDNTKMLRSISAIFILIFFLFYTSSGLVAGGKLFSTVFELDYFTALTIGVVVVISYTFLGGFMAVCWTDFFQGMLMVLAITAVPILGAIDMGGIGSTIDILNNIDPHLVNPLRELDGSVLPLISIISMSAWGLGYFGQPHILVRFMAIDNPEHIKRSRIIAMVWVTISLAFAVFVGLVGRAYLPQFLEGSASETVFMVMVNNLFHPVIAGVLLAAILAAIMSTADSQLLVSASAFTEDIYRFVFKTDASDKELVWMGRFTVITISIIAYLFALDPESSVLDLVSYAWAGFGAAFGPPIIFSLFSKKMTKNAALGGMMSGGLMVIAWKQLTGGIFDLYEIVPGFVISCIVIYVIMKLGEEPPAEVQMEFDRVNQ
ncbi:sodium/proline symporter [Methanohalobium evestigatum Z-7303]|uniref:Sodium/proline symporter n=1 Tax=Methanohalobium evestigatum (strain ATCC BAA-1072 / DSM 3721 / NBRC 107634 / OCM 161 / Z-7303) TaxID=644295 RepID=D7E9C7_METEZ|nr:sodium/proline symporter PutP [Methanohalobium evestigatum]ADI74199.1 sodium/proline symporter [Methanohalobium evestigatum Z-7303]